MYVIIIICSSSIVVVVVNCSLTHWFLQDYVEIEGVLGLVVVGPRGRNHSGGMSTRLWTTLKMVDRCCRPWPPSFPLTSLNTRVTALLLCYTSFTYRAPLSCIASLFFAEIR